MVKAFHESQEKEEEKATKEALQTLIKENEYAILHTNQKIMVLQKKIDDYLKTIALVRFLASQPKEKTAQHSEILLAIELNATKGLNEKKWKQLAMLKLKEKLLQKERIVLEQEVKETSKKNPK